MSNYTFRDARLDELAFLSRLDAVGGFTKAGPYPTSSPGSAEKQLVIHLLEGEYINGLDSLPWSYNGEMQNAINWHLPHGNAPMDRAQIQRKWTDIDRALGGQELSLAISHRGRVRLAELRQALKTGREREPFGILLDRRHIDQDLEIALLGASRESMLAVAFADLNGLKALNDESGHNVGDEAIRIYLQSFASIVGTNGEAYRRGGDEVVAILPGHDEKRALGLLERIFKQLGKEQLEAKGKKVSLTGSCGVVTCSDPKAAGAKLLESADEAMKKRAKPAAKKTNPWKSAIAVVGGEVQTI